MGNHFFSRGSGIRFGLRQTVEGLFWWVQALSMG
jgi:hypothetical protein